MVLGRTFDPEIGLETIGTVNLILAKWFAGIGAAAKAVGFIGRAERVLAFAANRPLELSAQSVADRIAHSTDEGVPQLPAPPNLESAVALIELAGHPHILGREAFAILDDAGCCEQLALVAVGAAGARVISAEGWSET